MIIILLDIHAPAAIAWPVATVLVVAILRGPIRYAIQAADRIDLKACGFRLRLGRKEGRDEDPAKSSSDRGDGA